MKVYDVDGLCQVLPFGRTKIKALISSKKIPVTKIGNKYIITEEKLSNWLNSLDDELYFDY